MSRKKLDKSRRHRAVGNPATSRCWGGSSTRARLPRRASATLMTRRSRKAASPATGKTGPRSCARRYPAAASRQTKSGAATDQSRSIRQTEPVYRSVQLKGAFFPRGRGRGIHAIRLPRGDVGSSTSDITRWRATRLGGGLASEGLRPAIYPENLLIFQRLTIVD